MIVCWRPAILDKDTSETSGCKKFDNQSEDRLLRVASGNKNNTIGGSKVVHLVSDKKLSKFLWQLLLGGDKRDSFLKA